jgi:hypothetical protein
MDFIERFFDISPDGGSGLLELLIFAVLIGVPAFLFYRWQRSRR